jgi:hypothetical protein
MKTRKPVGIITAIHPRWNRFLKLLAGPKGVRVQSWERSYSARCHGREGTTRPRRLPAVTAELAFERTRYILQLMGCTEEEIATASTFTCDQERFVIVP